MHRTNWSCQIFRLCRTSCLACLLRNDVTAQIQALEATPEVASTILDEICHAQAADDSLQLVLQALKDQAQPPHSGICQYPEDTRVLLSQWDLLVLQDDILYRKFHYPDGTMNFLQIVLQAKLHRSYIERLHGWTKTCHAVSRCVYFPG